MRLSMGFLAGFLAFTGAAPLYSMPRHAPQQAGQNGHATSVVIHEDHHDLSAPLRILAGEANQPSAPSAGALQQESRLQHPAAPAAQAAKGYFSDAAQQVGPTTPVNTIPGLNFDGISDPGTVSFPPDTNGSAGLTQFVEWVNLSYAVYDKTTGNLLLGPAPGNSFWTGFGGACETNNNGDPIAQYDKLANRWVMMQHASNSSAGPYFLCVAVSTTSDATGAYNRYAFQVSASLFLDYPKLGVWPDAYYASSNLENATTFAPEGALICALDRTNMLLGNTATSQCFTLSQPAVMTLLPSDLDGFTPPPAGSPNYLIGLGPAGLDLYQFHVDFINPANSTLSTPATITVTNYEEPCNGSAGFCITQPGTSETLDTLGDRLMYRNAYRNFGDHESLVVTHSVQGGNNTGIRWYEIRTPATANAPYQQGTFPGAPGDGNDRWMGSVAMDQAGDLAIGYSLSGTTIFPSIVYTGRLPSDPLGTLEGEVTVKSGLGSQLQSNRWGDYTDMNLDPVDDCTFWNTNEYLAASGTFNWSTRIASFRFPGCGNAMTTYSSTALNFGNVPVGDTGTQTFTITDSGTTPLVIVSIVPPAGFTESDTCNIPAPISPGGSCTVTVNFMPTADGIVTGNLVVTDNYPSANSTTNISLTGNGEPPPTLLPATLGFGNQTQGSTSAPQTVTLTNATLDTLTISSVVTTGTNATDFAPTSNCGTSVPSGGTCTITVTFTPTTVGAESGSLVVNSTPTQPAPVALTGTGTAGPTISPTSLSFGNQIQGTTSAPQTLTVTNNTGQVFTITGVTTTGTNAGDFLPQSACGSSLANGASCIITVSFMPSTSGAESASLNVNGTPAGAAPVPLSGTGTPPPVLSPSSVAFGTLEVGTTSAAQTVTLTNNSGVTITITSVATSSGNAADFKPASACGTTLANGASCTISVTFTPSLAAAETSLLTVSATPASPSPASLTGTGSSFAFSASSGGTSLTVAKGQTATYMLQAAPVNGFTGTLTLTCSGAPPLAVCTVPPTLTVGATAATFTATVTTAATGALPAPWRLGGPRGPHGPLLWLLGAMILMLLAGGLLFSAQPALRPSRRRLLAAGATFAFLAALAGCGGGGGGNSGGTPAGTYTLTVTGTAAAGDSHTLPLTLTVQ